jgi:hypothetical protein
MESQVDEVGTMYQPGWTSSPEGVHYTYRGGQHELAAFLRRPTLAELEALTEGPADFALYVDGDLLLLLYRFRSLELDPVIDWSDAPFSIHHVDDAERQLPTDERGRALLQVLVVDADNGLLHGKRAVTLDEEFTAALHRAIREQAARPWSSDEYDRALRQLYASHRSSDLARLAQHRTRGAWG